MIYIRTKDGIWRYNFKDNSAERPNKEFKCNQVWLNTKDIDIQRYANTIEELCDEFVIKPSFSKAFLHDEDKQPLKLVKQKAIESDCFIIYGAIWTDDGLKYVAKMNDKGELELL